MQEGVIRAFPPAGTSKALFLPVHSTFLVSLFRNKSKTERKAVLPDTAESVRAQQNLLPSNISLNKLIFVVCYQNIVWRQGQRVQFIGTQPSLKINIREIQNVGWHYLCPHLQHRSNAEDGHALAAERLGGGALLGSSPGCPALQLCPTSLSLCPCRVTALMHPRQGYPPEEKLLWRHASWLSGCSLQSA